MKFARHTGRKRHISGQMNKLEAAYAEHLQLRKLAGEILDFKFEAIKFRLADKTFYTPDFVVFAADGVIEIHETKAHWEDDARVKIKVFAALYPFRVLAITRPKGVWTIEDLTN